MTKITSTIVSELYTAATPLAARVADRSPFPVDADTLHEMCVGAENDQLLRGAALLLRTLGTKTVETQRLTVDIDFAVRPAGLANTQSGTPTMSVQTTVAHGQQRIYANNLRPDPEHPKFPLLQGWVQQRLELGSYFALPALLAHWFHETDRSLEALRYVIPGVLTLCQQSGYLGKYVDRLTKFRAPSDIPPLSPALRDLCREANSAIATSTLFEPADPTPTPPGGVYIVGLPSIQLAEYPRLSQAIL